MYPKNVSFLWKVIAQCNATSQQCFYLHKKGDANANKHWHIVPEALRSHIRTITVTLNIYTLVLTTLKQKQCCYVFSEDKLSSINIASGTFLHKVSKNVNKHSIYKMRKMTQSETTVITVLLRFHDICKAKNKLA